MSMVGSMPTIDHLLCVPSVLCADLGAYRLSTIFLTACLWGGQLAERGERSKECHNLYFGLESLIQPLSTHNFINIIRWAITCPNT